MAEHSEIRYDSPREPIAEERRELSHEARLEHMRWLFLRRVVYTSAIFAVLALVAAVAAEVYASKALAAADQAVLVQAGATNTWTRYYTDGLTQYQAGSEIAILRLVGGAPEDISAAQTALDASKASQTQLQPIAQGLDQQVADLNRQSAEFMQRHTRFAIAVACFGAALALVAIASLTRDPIAWQLSLVPGVLGALALLDGVTLTV